MAVFYRDVLGFHDISESWGRENRIQEQYGSPISFVEDDAGRQLHLSTFAPDLLFTTGREINMVGPAGHLAFRVDDIEELKRRLDAAGRAATATTASGRSRTGTRSSCTTRWGTSSSSTRLSRATAASGWPGRSGELTRPHVLLEVRDRRRAGDRQHHR